MIYSLYAVRESFRLYNDGGRYGDLTIECGCSSVVLSYPMDVYIKGI